MWAWLSRVGYSLAGNPAHATVLIIMKMSLAGSSGAVGMDDGTLKVSDFTPVSGCKSSLRVANGPPKNQVHIATYVD